VRVVCSLCVLTVDDELGLVRHVARPFDSGRGSPKLQIMLVASPRNQLYRHEKVARFWRPSCFLGGSQHRGQVASQLDPELAPLRRQDNRVNQSTERFRGFCACVFALECRGEFLDLRPVEVGHTGVKERRRLVGGF
jgi:hypothetical protein